MYILKDKTYAEAGSYLQSNSARGFGAPTHFGPFTERKIVIENLEVTEKFITFDQFRWANPGIRSYADAKKFVVSKRYSNDDQIAIMLNKDESEEGKLAYDKMQEWREWASVVAHKIMDCINSNNNGE